MPNMKIVISRGEYVASILASILGTITIVAVAVLSYYFRSESSNIDLGGLLIVIPLAVYVISNRIRNRKLRPKSSAKKNIEIR